MSQADTLKDPECLTDDEVNLFLDWKKNRMERIIKLDDLCDDIETRISEYGEVLLSSIRKCLVGNVSALASTVAAPFSGGLSLIGVTGSFCLFVRSVWNDNRAKGNLDVVIKEADKLLNQEEALLGKVIDIVNRKQYDDDTGLAKACDFVEVYIEYGSDDADNIPERRVHGDLLSLCQPPSVVAIDAENIYKSAECLKSAEEGARAVSETANAARKAGECAKAVIETSSVVKKSGGLTSAVDGTKALAKATNVMKQATEGIKTTDAGHMADEGASIANVTMKKVTAKLASVSKFGLNLNAIFIPVSIYQLISHENSDTHPKIQEIRGKIIGLLQELTKYNNWFAKCVENRS